MTPIGPTGATKHSDLDLQANEGEIYEFLGTSGAQTTINRLLDLVRPAVGDEVFGYVLKEVRS